MKTKMKRCSKCGERKILNAFDGCNAKRDKKQSWCRACCILYEHGNLVKLKHEAFVAYGGLFCNNCGTTLFESLTLDHITGCGAGQRKATQAGTIKFLRALRRQNWPPGLQVLCYNCNFLKFAHPTLLQVYAQKKRRSYG